MRAKICLIGEPAVGKTSLIRRYVLDEFDDEYIATMGAKVTKKEVEISDERVGNLTVSLLIWDIMGDKGFRELYKEAFFHGAQGIIAVCDVTKRETLSGLRSWIGLVSKVAGSVPTHFLGNKVDLKEGIAITESDVKRISDFETLQTLFPDAVCISARTGYRLENLSEAVAANYKGAELQFRVASSQSNGKVQSFLRAHGRILKEQYCDSSVLIEARLGRNQLPDLKRLHPESIEIIDA